MPKEMPGAAAPAEGEASPEAKRELEVKILDIGDPAAFVQKIEAAGGVLAHPRRLLRDSGFKPESGMELAEASGRTVDVDPGAFESVDDLRKAFKLMGVEVVEAEGQLRARVTGFPECRVRLRQEEGQAIFTVKAVHGASRTSSGERRKVADLSEEQVKVLGVAEFRRILSELGYGPKMVREKYRTTWILGNAEVSLNEGPVGNPWIEVESKQGKIRDITEAALKRLRYGSHHLFQNISDAENYLRQGVAEEQLQNLVFAEGSH